MARTALLAVLALGACAPPGPQYHSEIAPLLEARCISCHQAGGVAPFALTSYAEAKPMAAAMVAAVESGRMPPWQAADADVDYLFNPRLTAPQLSALKEWAEQGAPEGSKSARKLEVAPVGGGINRVDLTLPMPESYRPVQTPDDYRCFPIDWPKTEPLYVTGFNAIPGTPKQVHHIALYLIPPASAHLPKQWDAEEAGPGYTCFGGPFGNRTQFAVELINAWIPGGKGVTLPRGRGILVPPGATVVMQLHYNVEQGAPEADNTKLEFQLEKTVEKRAAYQPFLNMGWAAGGMPIPAGQQRVVHQHLDDPRVFFGLLGSPLNTTNGFNIEAVMFHMHKLGAEGELWLEKQDKTRKRVLMLPNWNFHWQLEYHLTEPLRFEPGDKLRVRCIFDNSQARQPIPRDVNWGENSTEEMCVANILSTE